MALGKQVLEKQALEAGLPPHRWAPHWAAASGCPSWSWLPPNHGDCRTRGAASTRHQSLPTPGGHKMQIQVLGDRASPTIPALEKVLFFSKWKRTFPTTKPELSCNCSHSVLCRPPHCQVTRDTPGCDGKAQAPCILLVQPTEMSPVTDTETPSQYIHRCRCAQ